jgi:hypothetical protein
VFGHTVYTVEVYRFVDLSQKMVGGNGTVDAGHLNLAAQILAFFIIGNHSAFNLLYHKTVEFSMIHSIFYAKFPCKKTTHGVAFFDNLTRLCIGGFNRLITAGQIAPPS